MTSRIPMGRIGVQKDIIGATLLLTFSATDFITGQFITVDGGLTAIQWSHLLAMKERL